MAAYRASLTKTENGLAYVAIGFADPAPNTAVVPAAIEAVAALRLPGGRGILFDGPASLPAAMALAHAVAHLYGFVACKDPKLGAYIIAISHDPAHRPGDVIPAGPADPHPPA
jgi:CRISPR-associated protein Csx3